MKKVEIKNKVVARGGGSLQTPSKGAAASVDLSAYLLASVFAEAFEVQQTEDGERYVLAKLPMAVSGGITMFADGGVLDLPTIYDGIPVDGKTIYWEDVALPDGGTTRVLKAKSGGSGTGGGGVLSWSGFSSGSFDGTDDASIVIPNNTNQLTNGAGFVTSSALSGYATQTWVNGGFLPLEGGTITGDLRLKGSGNYGNTLYFGDGNYCYLREDSDDHLYVRATSGVEFEINSYNYLGISAKGVKVNGGILTYNASSGYWELDGDLLVKGQITMED